MEKILKYAVLTLVTIYRSTGHMHVGGTCRFYPSCSDYAQQLLRKEKFPLAMKTIFKRLMKCHPWGGYES